MQPSAASLYEKDFHAWAQREAELLRANRLHQLDIENLAEEVEAMARSQSTELYSRFIVLLMHLLKWRYQPERRASPSWRQTIIEQRAAIETLLERNPSLKHIVNAEFVSAYPKGRKRASLETRNDIKRFPAECPFTLEQVLDDDFLPE